MNTADIAANLVPVLYEDQDYIFVSKPAGMRLAPATRAHHTGLDPLIRMLDCGALHLVMGLDAHVSGVVALARSAEAADRLKRTLTHARSVIEYQAIVDLGQRRTAPKRKKKTKRSKTKGKEIPPFTFQIVRQRRGLCLIAFPLVALRTAEVRAALRTAKLKTMGEPRIRKDKPRPLPTSRIYIHRNSVQFQHPSLRTKVSVSARVPRAFATALTAADNLEDLLETAVASRFQCLADGESDAFRLFTGKHEGFPGLVAEKVGPVVVLQTHQGKFQGDLDRVRRVAKYYSRLFGASAVYQKKFTKNKQASDSASIEASSNKPLLGKKTPEEIAIRENGMTFLVRPDDGQSIGLFLDQRDNRRRIRALAKGKRVLNAFAYTCGFSVAAAMGKAKEVVSVDISTKSLEWGKRNFAANKLPVGGHVFLRTSVFDYLPRAQRQKRMFDVIIIDAPTFARTKKPARTFSVAKDLLPLLTQAVRVLSPAGIILVSTNSRSLSLNWLKEKAVEAAEAERRTSSIIAAPPLPADFSVDRDYVKSLLVRIA